MSRKIKIVGAAVLTGTTRRSVAAEIRVRSCAGQGFKKMAYQARNLALRLRDLAAGGNERAADLWLPAERRYFRRLDGLINIEGIEARNRVRAALRADEQQGETTAEKA